MIKLYGEMIEDNKMRVDVISYSGNRPGGVEVEEVLEGEGTHYVDPATGRQWYESVALASDPVEQVKAKIEELQALLASLGGGHGGLGT